MKIAVINQTGMKREHSKLSLFISMKRIHLAEFNKGYNTI